MKRLLTHMANYLAFWLVILFAAGAMTVCVWAADRARRQQITADAFAPRHDAGVKRQ